MQASLRERFELGVAMMKDYRDEIERRLLGTATLLAGIVALLLGYPSARRALANQMWLLFLTIATIVLLLGMHVRNILHWLRRWHDIRDNTDRLKYMKIDYYVRYQDIPRAAAFIYLVPVLGLGLFILAIMMAIGVRLLPTE
jgi:uncharacterized membrane protein YhaH (DUF805 family)